MACSIALLKPHIGNINIIQFRQKELCYHIKISSTINSCCMTSLILKKVWSDDASCPKSAPNSDPLWVCFSQITHEFSEPQTWQFWRLTKPSMWKCASSLRIISLEKLASTFWWLIIHSTLLYPITLHFYKLSTVKLSFFQGCQKLNVKMPANSNLG